MFPYSIAGKAPQKTPVYREFKPELEWEHKEDQAILKIHLQGFKKDQLRVQLTTHDTTLKICGERPLDPLTKSKFHIEIRLPENTVLTTEIRAHFTDGCLSITIPKIKHETNAKISSSFEPSKINDEKTKQEPDKDQSTAAPPPSQDSISGDGAKQQQKTPSDGHASPEFESRVQNTPTSGIRMAAATAAVAVLVAYVVYIYVQFYGW